MRRSVKLDTLETVLTLATLPILVIAVKLLSPCASSCSSDQATATNTTAPTVSPESTGPAKAPKWLHGLWMRADIETWSEDVQFHYFHDDGKIGLYRYGKRCLNNTHSYNYFIDEKCDGAAKNQSCVKFQYRKSGQTYASRVTHEKRGEDEFLTIAKDPEHGRRVKYKLVRPPVDGNELGVSADWDRMWTNISEFKTGGIGFSIYQFKKPGMDHRGIGWFHKGDFDDWSTESLTYRRRLKPNATDKGGLELEFTCAKAKERTPFHVTGTDKKALKLKKDPRNYWASSTYQDGGQSFVADASTAELPFALSLQIDELFSASQPLLSDEDAVQPTH